jgi:hypothetical protein
MRNCYLFLTFAMIAASLLSGCAARQLSPVAGAGAETEAG